jgi:plasmid stabilization system protein ParE
MRVVYHPSVQKDVNRILRHYDTISPKLGDEFWDELTSQIEIARLNPQRFHFGANGRRRVNLRKFPYHFLFREDLGQIRITVVRHHRRHPNLGLKRR